jgi:CheY-like chemotaxis protein
VGAAAGLARLRDEVFDAVLVTHEPGELDALALIEGYRAGGADEPIIVLGTQSEPEVSALCYEVGADGYLCVTTATTRNLIWMTARAVQRHELIRQNQRLFQAEQSRIHREHDEAERLLSQQRALISDIERFRLPEARADAASTDTSSRPLPLPEPLLCHYRELLRTYVIMGSGNLGSELSRLARLLIAAGLTARETLQLHLAVVEELVRGLGARSARHVMNRADLLVLEVMVHLAEGYRRRYRERVDPRQQMLLPGFEQAGGDH